MHGDKNFPFHKEQSDLDIPLDDGVGDEEYLTI
jgi:acetoin utilization deacetylase AcuC-like enzyme